MNAKRDTDPSIGFILRIKRISRLGLTNLEKAASGKKGGLAPALCKRARFCLLLMTVKKLLSREHLVAERQRLRAIGKKLVFTNGVFDILHVGHVRYLEQARALGDALVVAINSDRSVRELKGDDRPLMTQDERAEILAALTTVDYVTVFDELSPRALIVELLPDVLVKGGDYALNEIHGREEVEAAGGRVLSLPFVEGQSSTRIIERIKQWNQ
jgi:D-beta-D-heptose 7-phosphate kinase/D-beta-D-heptose 1-phosphate adenosyltransferase